MSEIRKVLICDDEHGIREKWKHDLEQLDLKDVGFEVIHDADGKFLNDAIKQLELRRKAVRNGKSPTAGATDAELDNVDVLIVDYDLLDLDESVYFTGEDVAYLARCYSRCGFVLAINQYGSTTFDLTLKGHVESYADLNIGERHLANPNLWGKTGNRFKPWYWPIIPDFLNRQELRITDVEEHPDKPLLSVLGFMQDDIDTLPKSAVSYLMPGSEEEKLLSEITFKDFVVNSSLGLRSKDNLLDDDLGARICAARLSKWLERVVLPSQEYLIDAPHLVLKFPSLSNHQIREPSDLAQTTTREIDEVSLDTEKLRDFVFEKNFWFNRPTWWWRRLRDFEEIEEVRDPWSVDRPDVVFCEDVSEFLPRTAARDFVADVSSPAPQRWVVDVGSEEGNVYSEDLRGIRYTPPVRFTL